MKIMNLIISNISEHHWIPFIFCILMFIDLCILIYRLLRDLNSDHYIPTFNINSGKGNENDKNKLCDYRLTIFACCFLTIVIVCLNYGYNLGLAEWFSAFGTIFAVIIALFHDEILRPQLLFYHRKRDLKNHHYLVVQITNHSPTSTFAQIYHIFFTKNAKKHTINKNNKNQDSAIPTEIKGNLDLSAFPIKSHSMHNVIIFDEINRKNIQILKYAIKMYKKKKQYKYLAIEFQDFSNGEIIYIPIPLDSLFNKLK